MEDAESTIGLERTAELGKTAGAAESLGEMRGARGVEVEGVTRGVQLRLRGRRASTSPVPLVAALDLMMRGRGAMERTRSRGGGGDGDVLRDGASHRKVMEREGLADHARTSARSP